MRRVVFNQKGGVGKTSITCNLAAIGAAMGYRTLVVDLDVQGNTTHYLVGEIDAEAFPAEAQGVAGLFKQTVGSRRMRQNPDSFVWETPYENLYLMLSDNIHFWYEKRLLVPPAHSWEFVQLGNCGSPIETEAGWLAIYHGVKYVVGDPIYRLGAALLDREKPHRLIGRARRWLLGPSEPYERSGDAPNVVFASGGFVRGDDLWIYYGAADSCICLATAKLAEVLSLVTSD